MVHLTGRNNYKDFTSYHKENWGENQDFEKNPELISSDVKYAVRAALYFWEKNGLYKIADKGFNDQATNSITKVINEKTGSYSERRKNLEKIAKERIFKEAF
ncbi:hypothetical protein BM451_18070 [Dickeya dadantii]|nr:hypothetical protein BM451_18070 [Dickeya dadantii]